MLAGETCRDVGHVVEPNIMIGDMAEAVWHTSDTKSATPADKRDREQRAKALQVQC